MADDRNIPDFVQEAEAELARRKDFDPKAAAEARKAEMDQMTEKLEAGVKDVFQGDNFRQYLDFCAKLPRYSINNQILIMMQRPDASMCQSFTGWKEMGRFVKKGEKGIRIMAPAPYKMEREQDKIGADGKPVLDKDGEPVKEVVEVKVNAFKPVSTFDISQTDGEPVPQVGATELLGSVEGYTTLFEAIEKVVPVPITFEQIESGAKGFYSLEENRIAIQEGMSEAQTVKTALHEASHQALHSREAMDSGADKKSRNQKECEAESIAYVVCQHYGIDTSEYSFPYVATWSADKDVPELKASLETIRRTASDLITKIDEQIQEIMVARGVDQFISAESSELPFDNPETSQEAGYVEIIPPVDMSDLKADKPIEITAEDVSKKEDKSQDQKQDKKEEPAKKKSVKKQIEAKKEKAAKQPKPKKVDTKNLGEAI